MRVHGIHAFDNSKLSVEMERSVNGRNKRFYSQAPGYKLDQKGPELTITGKLEVAEERRRTSNERACNKVLGGFYTMESSTVPFWGSYVPSAHHQMMLPPLSVRTHQSACRISHIEIYHQWTWLMRHPFKLRHNRCGRLTNGINPGNCVEPSFGQFGTRHRGGEWMENP